MEPLLIYTDSSFVDAGAVRSFSLDMAFGSDEQDFEATFTEPKLYGGELLYIDGTEYGGIVDSIRQDTDNQATTYCGRTWHGMLAAKVVKPPASSDYYTASGDANACLAALISYVGLSGVLTARSASSGISIANYQFPRFCNAYAGALGMLGSVNAKLVIKRHDGITEAWAEPVSTIEDRADSDLMEFEVTENHRVPNHLVAAGQGELQDRVVVDLYADANGNVSTSQTFTGVDEIAVFYDYTGADSAELVKEGTAELKDYQSKGGADIKALAVGDWYVGDRLQVRDNRTGTVVTSTIAKKIVRVDMGVLSVDYEVGENVGTKAASFTAEVSGHTESGGAYLPLSGGTLSGNLSVTGTLDTSGKITASNANVYVKRSALDTTAADNGLTSASYAYQGFIDSNDRYAGWLGNVAYTDGRIVTQLTARRSNGGSNLDNQVQLGVRADGTRYVTVSDAAAWRAALGIGTFGFATGASDATLSTTATKAALTVLRGEGCSLYSNGIKVANSGWYEISASYEFRSGLGSNDICHILVKNGTTTIAHALWRTYSANPYYTMVLPTFVAQLAADDVVYMYVYNQNGARGTARALEDQGNGLYVKQLG